MFQKFYEQGYIPIPIYKHGKNPSIMDWSRWCTERPTQAQIDQWQELYNTNNLNIGITCGKASGIIALDIDTDDPEIMRLCPPSMVRRKGMKGEVRFFRYSDKIKNHSLPLLLDILSDGRQVLVPPSIHPTTLKAYEWLTPDTLLDVKPHELPELDISFLEKIAPEYKKRTVAGSGRNNKIVDIISSMRCRGESEGDVVREVYTFDKIHNTPRLFMDQSEGFSAKGEDDAMKNAAIMVNRVSLSLIKSGVLKISDGNMSIHISDDEEQKIIKEAQRDAFKFKPYPAPRGIMGGFQELCDLKSSGNQDATGLGGAIALMSVLASNKFVTECRGLITCPNIYVINLGFSSFGKEMAQSILNDLLADSGLLGNGSYKSDVSFIMNLPNQQERLDVIDECSTLLKAMGSKEGYASNIVELLSELFTKGASKYAGQTTVANGAGFGACYNPHVSLIGSTTPNAFRSSVNKEIAAKGLLPRMLLFYQNDIGGYRGRRDRKAVPSLTKDLAGFVNDFLRIPKITHPDFIPKKNFAAKKQGKDGEDLSHGVKYKHKLIPLSDEASDTWYSYEEKCHDLKRRDPEGFESAFIGRFAELAAKLALLDALSLGRPTIEADSLEWAISVVETQWYNAKPLYELAHAENKTESDVLRIISFVNSVGIIDRKALRKKFRFLEKKILDQAIDTAQETGQIEVKVVNRGTAGRPTTYYLKINPKA